MGASTVIVATGYDERGKNSKNFMQAFQPGRRGVPFPLSHYTFVSPSTNSCPSPCPLLAHSRRTTVLLSGSIMKGSTRWDRASWCEGNTGTGSSKSGFNVAGCLRCCASCNGPSCELFKCVESPAS